MKKKFGIILFFLLTSTSFALSTKINGCPHKFTTTLQTGDTHEDVKILQQILNSDSRTVVSHSGPGSNGQETNFFGKATRDALKRFQALFIEYIGVADGKFNDRTRTVIQSICGTDKSTIDTASSTTSINKLPLLVRLTANTENISGSQIKILVEFNKEVKKVDVGAFIVNGASVSDVRKLSKTQFSVIVSPQSNTRNITLQVEADRVTDIDGVKNAEASNEIILTNNNIPVEDQGIIQNTINNIGDTLSGLLNQFSSSRPGTKYCNGIQVLESANCTPSAGSNAGTGGGSVPAGTGQVPVNTGGSGAGGGAGAGGLPTGGAGGQNQSQQMLNSLLKGLSGGQSGQNNPGSTAGSGIGDLGVGSDTGEGEGQGAGQINFTDQCPSRLLSDGEFRSELSKNQIAYSFGRKSDGMPENVILMLKQIEANCKCKIFVTSGTRSSSPTSKKTEHGSGRRVVDLSYQPEITKYITTVGKKISTCKYLISGVTFLDEKNCPSGAASGPHWHVNGIGWLCSQTDPKK